MRSLDFGCSQKTRISRTEFKRDRYLVLINLRLAVVHETWHYTLEHANFCLEDCYCQGLKTLCNLALVTSSAGQEHRFCAIWRV